MYISQNVKFKIYQNRFENIKNYILYNLGYPVIRVELTEQHFLLSIIEAVGLFYKMLQWLMVTELFQLKMIIWFRSRRYK
jgi:hypothetical protein